MQIEDFINIIDKEFYTGVPDSYLNILSSYLNKNYKENKHIIAANEGNCVGLAAGYHLSTGKTPVIYMQNSGLGNTINPIASLTSEKVYNIPVLFIIGWRGEPNIKDEPQHVFQGEITEQLLKDLKIKYFIVDNKTSKENLKTVMKHFNSLFEYGKCAAILVKKDAFIGDKEKYFNDYTIQREEAIKLILDYSDIVISTTGKISREIFELREQNSQGHNKDFLTVGSMGHASSIALGIALNKTNRKIWCIDGDGAMLMHMGALATIGNINPSNLIHILLNNESHESVGGMPTTSKIDFYNIAKNCGYKNVFIVDKMENLNDILKKVTDLNELSFIEIKCSISSRKDLGRPTTTPVENKINFMNFLKEN